MWLDIAAVAATAHRRPVSACQARNTNRRHSKAANRMNRRRLLRKEGVASIRSAQATDVAVNKVTPVLFRRYPTPHDLAEAPPDDVKDIIRTTGFFNNKAKSIQGAARKIDLDFDGRVPDTMPDLLTLPG